MTPPPFLKLGDQSRGRFAVTGPGDANHSKGPGICTEIPGKGPRPAEVPGAVWFKASGVFNPSVKTDLP